LGGKEGRGSEDQQGRGGACRDRPSGRRRGSVIAGPTHDRPPVPSTPMRPWLPRSRERSNTVLVLRRDGARASSVPDAGGGSTGGWIGLRWAGSTARNRASIAARSSGAPRQHRPVAGRWRRSAPTWPAPLPGRRARGIGVAGASVLAVQSTVQDGCDAGVSCRSDFCTRGPCAQNAPGWGGEA
jgi:hypothetical protein